jgi:hypothetical protein
MKKPTTEEQGISLTEALARLKSSLTLAQSANNRQEILSLERVIACFERKLKCLKSFK